MKDQKKILINNETKVLEGRNKINTIILAGILLLSFIGLGHSVGGLKDLQKSMDNPYTKWVNLAIPSTDYKNSNELQNYFQSKRIRDSFFIDTIHGYKRDSYRFVSLDGKKVQYKRSRTIDPGEQLLEEILKPTNMIWNSLKGGLIGDMGNCWIIATKEMADQFSNSENQEFKYMNINLSWQDDNAFSLYVPLVAIVEDLPDHADFVISEHFDELLDKNIDKTGFVEINETNSWTFLSQKQYNVEDVQPIIGDSMKISSIDAIPWEFNDSFLLHRVYQESPISLEVKFNLFRALSKRIPIRPYHEYECDIGSYLVTKNAEYLAISFNDLRNVRMFRDFIKGRYGFDISLNQVEDKENFLKVARLTLALAFILFVTSMAGVLIFIVNLLRAHFDKIQGNLGTFKAFGLSNDRLRRDYSYITMLFFGKSIIYAVVGVVGYSILMSIINIKYILIGKFMLIHWSFPLAILFILVVVYWVIRWIIRTKLSKTPGDLIYNR